MPLGAASAVVACWAIVGVLNAAPGGHASGSHRRVLAGPTDAPTASKTSRCADARVRKARAAWCVVAMRAHCRYTRPALPPPARSLLHSEWDDEPRHRRYARGSHPAAPMDDRVARGRALNTNFPGTPGDDTYTGDDGGAGSGTGSTGSSAINIIAGQAGDDNLYGGKAGKGSSGGVGGSVENTITGARHAACAPSPSPHPGDERQARR